jgi:hypothetical protein
MTATIAQGARRQRWTARGRFAVRPGQAVDPDSQEVDVTFAHAGRVLYDEPSAPGTFHQSRDRCARTWSAVHGGDVFRQRHAPGAGSGACSDTVLFALDGRTEGATPLADGARLRESVRVGDTCVTAVVECHARGRRLRCGSR